MELGEHIYSEQDLIDVDDLPKVELNQFKTSLETYSFFINELINRTTDKKQLELLNGLKNPRYNLTDDELWEYEEILINNKDLEPLSSSRALASKELDAELKKKEEQENKALDIKELLTMEVNIDWVLDGLKPATVGFLVGSGGSGKSRLVFQMLCSLATGIDFVGIMKNLKKQKVSYITTEDDKDECSLRIKNIMKHSNLNTSATNEEIINDLDKNLMIYSKTGKAPYLFKQGDYRGKFETTENIKWLNDIASKSRLVVLDPLSHFIGPLDENSNGDMGIFMSEIKGIASKNNCAILILHHMNKGSATSGLEVSQNNARGASNLVDTARLQLSLTALSEKQLDDNNIDEENKKYFKVLTVTKGNYIEPQEPIILKSDFGVFTKFDKNNKLTFQNQTKGIKKIK